MTDPRAMPPADEPQSDPPHDPQLQYASPQVKQGASAARRPLRVWLILLAVWSVGLLIWAVYLILLVLLVVRFF